jgi:hypothetical protein
MHHADMDQMKQRFEMLKKMYFRSQSSAYDEDGQEVPMVMDRQMIVQMFNNMGVELPLSPSDPMKLVGR